jgi:hypothetical protein
MSNNVTRLAQQLRRSANSEVGTKRAGGGHQESDPAESGELFFTPRILGGISQSGMQSETL